MARGVYVYPQINTVPQYYPVFPSYSVYPYAAPYYGSSYSYGTWGESYYPVYPSGGYSTFRYYFRLR